MTVFCMHWMEEMSHGETTNMSPLQYSRVTVDMRQPGGQWIWKVISLQNSTLSGESLVSDKEFNTAVQQQ